MTMDGTYCIHFLLSYIQYIIIRETFMWLLCRNISKYCLCALMVNFIGIIIASCCMLIENWNLICLYRNHKLFISTMYFILNGESCCHIKFIPKNIFERLYTGYGTYSRRPFCLISSSKNTCTFFTWRKLVVDKASEHCPHIVIVVFVLFFIIIETPVLAKLLYSSKLKLKKNVATVLHQFIWVKKQFVFLA